ncbi:MAG: hypothetical protein CMJ95_01115 [Planctomycetes bacterium]|nr:hypothetical protein [Planctomycetota bacterium]
MPTLVAEIRQLDPVGTNYKILGISRIRSSGTSFFDSAPQWQRTSEGVTFIAAALETECMRAREDWHVCCSTVALTPASI